MNTQKTSTPDEFGAAHGSPFVVPPFESQWTKPEVRFFWWSWHPNYPSWSRYGGKGYATEDEAWEQREGDGAFTVVADDPCRKLDVWRAIKAKMENDHDNQTEI